MDVVTSLANAGRTDIKVIGGRYGLASKDTPPASVFAVYKELAKANPKRQFTVGIVDDVTRMSLRETSAPDTAPKGTVSCMFWGLGGDGTVGANKNSIKIIGDHTDKYVQAYFQYDSKKTGGVTISHLRFGDKPIKSRTISTRPTSWPATTRATSPRASRWPRSSSRAESSWSTASGALRSSSTISTPRRSATSPRTRSSSS